MQFSEVKRVYLNACEVRRCCLKPSNDNSSVETDDFFPQARRADWKKLMATAATSIIRLIRSVYPLGAVDLQYCRDGMRGQSEIREDVKEQGKN